MSKDDSKALFVYLTSIVIGFLLSYMTYTDYRNNSEIKQQGVSKRVVFKGTEYVNKMRIPQIEYKGRIYNYYGGNTEMKVGDSLSVVYSPQKDEFVKAYKDAHYAHIFLWLFIMLVGVFGVIKLSLDIIKK